MVKEILGLINDFFARKILALEFVMLEKIMITVI
jgi:hypothetical protein